jgi:glycosyltransferase involved in cell wall biosynthesis
MKIAHVLTRLQRSGSERNIAHFVDWQQEHGHEVVVVAGPQPDASLMPPGVKVVVLPHLVRELSPRHDRRAMVELGALLDAERCEVLHTHQSKAGALGRLMRHPRDRVVAHTVHMPSFGPAYGRKSAAFVAIERRCAQRTDFLLTVGQEMRELYLAAGIGSPTMYRILRSPIDIDAFARARNASDADRRSARIRLGLDPSRPTILAVGALEARKRHDLAISAVQPLVESEQVQFVIAGDGPERARLEQHARQLGIGGSVHLVGFLDDVQTAFVAADVMVHTSATEGVAQVVVQSLAAGVPVVSTSVEGIQEIDASGTAVTDPAGLGLTDQLRSTLHAPPAPCDLETLAPWRASNVEQGIYQLHEDMSTLLRERRRQPATRIRAGRG